MEKNMSSQITDLAYDYVAQFVNDKQKFYEEFTIHMNNCKEKEEFIQLLLLEKDFHEKNRTEKMYRIVLDAGRPPLMQIDGRFAQTENLDNRPNIIAYFKAKAISCGIKIDNMSFYQCDENVKEKINSELKKEFEINESMRNYETLVELYSDDVSSLKRYSETIPKGFLYLFYKFYNIKDAENAQLFLDKYKENVSALELQETINTLLEARGLKDGIHLDSFQFSIRSDNNIDSPYSSAVKYLLGIDRKLSLDSIEDYFLKEEKKKKEYSNSSKGCYIASYIYGSYNCPEVWVLRRYRDFYLDKHWWGRLFIKVYYKVSPTLVRWFGETKWFKSIWKPFLEKKLRS